MTRLKQTSLLVNTTRLVMAGLVRGIVRRAVRGALREKVRNLIAGFSLLAVPAVVQAGGLLDPFATASRNPFVQIYGLPAAQSAQLTTAGRYTVGLQLEAASNFAVNDQASELIIIDGETHRANLQLQAGVSDRLELGLDLPYLSHESGSLDSFIDEWHDFFGFPDGDRAKYPRDQLRFAYQRDGQLLADLREPGAGIGDVSLSMGYQLSQAPTRQWALRTRIKLPTGDVDELLGSESTDVAVGLHVSDQSWLEQSGIALHGSVGLMWMDEGDVLQAQREDWVLYGSATLGWQAFEHVSFKLQLDAHSAFYDSALTELGSDSAQLVVGGAIRLSERWVLDLAVSEDIAVDTAPDVVFIIGIKAGEF